MTIRDNRDYIRVLSYSDYTTVTGWGVLLICRAYVYTQALPFPPSSPQEGGRAKQIASNACSFTTIPRDLQTLPNKLSNYQEAYIGTLDSAFRVQGLLRRNPRTNPYFRLVSVSLSTLLRICFSDTVTTIYFFSDP